MLTMRPKFVTLNIIRRRRDEEAPTVGHRVRQWRCQRHIHFYQVSREGGLEREREQKKKVNPSTLGDLLGELQSLLRTSGTGMDYTLSQSLTSTLNVQ